MTPLVGIICDFKLLLNGMAEHQAGDEYVSAIRDGTGALPLLIPAAGLAPSDILSKVDGLLFTGAVSNVEPRHYGGDEPGSDPDPARDATSLPLLRAAVAAGKPTLCICRGVQELNVALGGTLHQRLQEIPGRLDHRGPKGVPPDEEYAAAHAVGFTAGGVLARLTGVEEAMVNSLHSQGIDRLAPGLAIEARAPDGQIEAVSGPGGFLLGVQWHPEWRWAEDRLSRAIFQAFGVALGGSGSLTL
jgi:putative glutamine amidotransferase